MSSTIMAIAGHSGDAFRMWRGQTGFFRCNDFWRSLAAMRGCLSNFRYAVALVKDPNQRAANVKSLQAQRSLALRHPAQQN